MSAIDVTQDLSPLSPNSKFVLWLRNEEGYLAAEVAQYVASEVEWCREVGGMIEAALTKLVRTHMRLFRMVATENTGYREHLPGISVAVMRVKAGVPMSAAIDVLMASVQCVFAAWDKQQRDNADSRQGAVTMHMWAYVAIVAHELTDEDRAFPPVDLQRARGRLCADLVVGRQVTEDDLLQSGINATDILAVLAIQDASTSGHKTYPATSVPSADLEIRRRTTVVRRHLERCVSTLATIVGDIGVFILMHDAHLGSVAHESHVLREQVCRAVTASTRETGRSMVAALQMTRFSDVAPAASLAMRLVGLARTLGRPAGTYGLRDLLFEYHVTSQPGSSREALAGLVAPVCEQPKLLATMRAHFRYGADRQTAAQALGIHPNSYVHRLHRIAELTGINPSNPPDAHLLAAALIVWETTSSTAGVNEPPQLS
ncbi:PucR family transcriptional regulator [Gordonia effusa]|uniref:PucR family transcriptional regulator n=1 Tax=Gordonia effusa TaxID=263908 RepID=UPI000306E7EC|nr:helix-turn-helix domain-containing protein [Gordonia effusa]